MRNKILVVGGYGKVGRIIAARLATTFPDRVIVAGRDVARAAAFASETGQGIEPRRLDLADMSHVAQLLDDVQLAIVCIEQNNALFARACLERGIHYIDISASDHILQQIEALDALAQQHAATAVLSVGLSPGLTNMLARYLHDLLDVTHSIDIFLLLDLGEAHGADAIRWIVQNASQEFSVQTRAGTRLVQNLSEPQAAVLPGGYGRRTFYRFNFADQHVLARTLGVQQVITRLCFDSALATRGLALLQRAGVAPHLNKLDPHLLARVFGRLKLGSDQFVVHVEARGVKQQQSYRCCGSAVGHGEAQATGSVTAIVAETLLTTAQPRGVYHIEQLFDPQVFFRQCQQAGIYIMLEALPVT